MADETADTTEGAPQAPQTPKERRASRRAKARSRQGAGKALTPEQRQELRDAERARKAAQRRRRRAKEKVKRAETRADQPAVEQAPAKEHGPGRPKRVQGIVVSDKADKTIVVQVEEAKKHPRYRKVMRRSIKVHAHDERNEAHTGDTVRVIESRPLSATKRWRLVEVVERAR